MNKDKLYDTLSVFCSKSNQNSELNKLLGVYKYRMMKVCLLWL